MLTDITKNGIRTICLDAAPLNLIDLEMVTTLSQALTSHEQSHPLIITGANGVFSAGVDTKAFTSYSREQKKQFFGEISRMTARLVAIESPVIAAVPGHALGGGFVIPLCADYRILSGDERTSFGLPEAAAGVPFPAGPMAILLAEVPMPILRTMCLTSKNIAREELINAGVYDEILDPDDLSQRAEEIAVEMNNQPAFSRVKSQIRGHLRKQLDEIIQRDSS